MNEVEKLMQNANVEREFAYLECHRGRSSICCPIEEYEKDEECMGCINSSAMKKVYEYPQFTAEKQLALFQWVCKKFEEIYISYTDFEEVKSWEIVYKISVHRNSFEECLCAFINRFWQGLTEEERKQIKEILE